MILGFGKGKKKADEKIRVDDELTETVRFLGPHNGNEVDLSANAKLAEAGLGPAKKLITDALARRAEILRLEPKGNAAIVGLMVDGVAYPGGRMPKQLALAVTQMIKLLAGLNTRNRKKPQSGGMDAEWQGDSYELLVDSTPTSAGAERLVIRARNLKQKLESPADLGFSDDMRATIRELATKKSGFLLGCGPPNSGTTTTTFALTRAIDPYQFQIFSIANMRGRELSYVHDFELLPEDDLVESIDRIARAEADVLFLDPIRNAREAKTLFSKHEKLTFVSEFVAKNAVEGLLQLIKWLEEPQLVAEGLQGIISQKLIRVLCADCKQAFPPNPKLLAKVGLPPETNILYREKKSPKGAQQQDLDFEPCETCGGIGYFGRAGMFEFIEMTESMRKVVETGPSAKELRDQIRNEKMQTLQKEGLKLVAEGRTSLEELQRAFKSA